MVCFNHYLFHQFWWWAAGITEQEGVWGTPGTPCFSRYFNWDDDSPVGASIMSALSEVSQMSSCLSGVCRFLLSHQTEQKGKQPVPSQWSGDKGPGCNGSFSHGVQELCYHLVKVNILCTQAFKRGTMQTNLWRRVLTILEPPQRNY